MVQFVLSRLTFIALLTFLCALEALGNNIPFRHFSIADGLPHENVRAITQSPDGRIWVGTSAGLIYYNGQLFEQVHFTGAAGTVNINEVLTLENGAVWVSTSHQGIWQVQHHKAVQAHDALKEVTARRMVAHNSSLLLFADRALWQVDIATDQLVSLEYRYPARLNELASATNDEKRVVSADVSEDGQHWILDYRFGPGMLSSDGSVRFLDAKASPGWYALQFDERGMGWMTHEGRGLFRFDPRSGEITQVIETVGVRHICVTPQMIVVTSYQEGALFWDLDKEVQLPAMNEASGLPTNRINCIFRDHEGNSWIGTQIGLLHISQPGVKHLLNVDDSPLVNLNDIFRQSDGTVWASSHTEGLFQLAPEYKSVRPAGETRWSDLFRGQDGRLHALGLNGWYAYEDRWGMASDSILLRGVSWGCRS